jgi:hypothetical protein
MIWLPSFILYGFGEGDGYADKEGYGLKRDRKGLMTDGDGLRAWYFEK